MGWSGMYSHLLWFLVMNCFFFWKRGGGVEEFERRFLYFYFSVF